MKYDLLMNVDLHEALDEALQEMVRDPSRRGCGDPGPADQLVSLFIDELREQLARKGLYRWVAFGYPPNRQFLFLPVDEADEIDAWQAVRHAERNLKDAQQFFEDTQEENTPKPTLRDRLGRVGDFLRGRWYGA